LTAAKRKELADKFNVSEGYLVGASLLKKTKMIAEVISGDKSFQLALKEAKGPQDRKPEVVLVFWTEKKVFLR
jgi:hypothetical protein